MSMFEGSKGPPPIKDSKKKQKISEPSNADPSPPPVPGAPEEISIPPDHKQAKPKQAKPKPPNHKQAKTVPPIHKQPPPSPPQEHKASTLVTQNPTLKVKRGGLIGAIMVDNEFLTNEQRAKCLQIQTSSSENLLFGQIAISQGFITKEILELTIDAQKRYEKNIREEQSRVFSLPPKLFEEEEVKVKKQSDSTKLLGLLKTALDHGASDLHMITGKPIVLRRNGLLFETQNSPLSKEDIKANIISVLSDEEQKIFKKEGSIVKCIELTNGGRARCNFFHHIRGINCVFRLMPNTVPSIVSLNLPKVLGKFTTYPQGLVLVTGPMGSGKTTTLAALVEVINNERKDHILTIENPIEFVIKSNKSLITQREIGSHTMGYSAALRAALREDPDVIIVGEMNNLETTRLTMSAAETGHLVFATLHTQNAVRSVNRLLDMFPADEQTQVLSILAESLRGVISQTLVPRCDVEGLIPVVDVMVSTPAIRNLIHDRKIHLLRNTMKLNSKAGNISFEDHAVQLRDRNLISKDTCSIICNE